MKPTVTVVYTIDYVIDFAENYGFTKCKKCFNLKTGREIKQHYKSNCLGYYINSKFYSLTRLKNHLIKPKRNNCPF